MEHECCHKKATPRTDETVRGLQNRLNRIIGQLNGIKKMLYENRYCGEILIQTAAAEKALGRFADLVLEEHLDTCVREELAAGNTAIVSEAVELIRKLK